MSSYQAERVNDIWPNAITADQCGEVQLNALKLIYSILQTLCGVYNNCLANEMSCTKSD